MTSIVDLIKHHEGFRANAYTCPVGKLTVGYGRNLDDKGLTESEADYLLSNDIQTSISELSRKIEYRNLKDPIRRAVLIDMHYNLGITRLNGFKKMWAAISDQDFNRAADEMRDSRWAKQVRSRADRLIGMMKTGKWPDDVPATE